MLSRVMAELWSRAFPRYVYLRLTDLLLNFSFWHSFLLLLSHQPLRDQPLSKVPQPLLSKSQLVRATMLPKFLAMQPKFLAVSVHASHIAAFIFWSLTKFSQNYRSIWCTLLYSHNHWRYWLRSSWEHFGWVRDGIWQWIFHFEHVFTHKKWPDLSASQQDDICSSSFVENTQLYNDVGPSQDTESEDSEYAMRMRSLILTSTLTLYSQFHLLTGDECFPSCSENASDCHTDESNTEDYVEDKEDRSHGKYNFSYAMSSTWILQISNYHTTLLLILSRSLSSITSPR